MCVARPLFFAKTVAPIRGEKWSVFFFLAEPKSTTWAHSCFFVSCQELFFFTQFASRRCVFFSCLFFCHRRLPRKKKRTDVSTMVTQRRSEEPKLQLVACLGIFRFCLCLTISPPPSHNFYIPSSLPPPRSPFMSPRTPPRLLWLCWTIREKRHQTIHHAPFRQLSRFRIHDTCR